MATSIKDGQDDLYPIMVLAANMIFVGNLCLLEYVSYLLSSLVVNLSFSLFVTYTATMVIKSVECAEVGLNGAASV